MIAEAPVSAGSVQASSMAVAVAPGAAAAAVAVSPAGALGAPGCTALALATAAGPVPPALRARTKYRRHSPCARPVCVYDVTTSPFSIVVTVARSVVSTPSSDTRMG